MSVMTVEACASRLEDIIEETTTSHKPVFIKTARQGAVLISEADWRAIEDTLYLNSIPGMVESIHEAMREPLSESVDTLPW